METTYIVLIALAIIYVPIFLYVKFNKKMEEKGLLPYGPCVMIRTKFGLRAIDRLGRYKRFWHVCGYASRIITIILMAYIVIIIMIDLAVLPMAIGRGGIGIEYALAIPGLNPMLPIVYGWIGLIIAMVMHELSHGIQSRANDIPVDHTGLLYAVVPVGAFVEPNEDEIQKASRGARMDLYAAGITMNFIIAVITFVLMFSMASCALTSDYEDSPAIYGYTTNSPMMEYNIPTTSVITGLDGTAITTADEFVDYIDARGFGAYDLRYVYKGTERTVSGVKLGTYINTVVKDSPAFDYGLESGDYIMEIDGRTVGTPWSMSEILSTIDAGTAVTLKYYDSSESAERTIDGFVLGDNNGKGYIGISTTISGMSITTPGIVMSTGIEPYYGCSTVGDFGSATISYLAKAFNGFSPVPESTHWWYHSSFISDDVTWVIILLLYWIFWLNIVLAVTNALPAVPFDGGFLFAGGMDYIAEKFIRDEKKREDIVNRICTAMTYFMIFALIIVLIVIIV